jgi:hypothetical protein
VIREAAGLGEEPFGGVGRGERSPVVGHAVG